MLVAARTAAAALGVLVLARALGAERGTLLVLLVGALPLVLLLAYGVLAAGLALRRPLLAGAGALLVAAHVAVVAPALGAEPQPPGGSPLRVVVANLYVLNPDPEAAGRALRALEPDVLVVPELSPAGLAGLRASGLLEDLPQQVAELGVREETVGLFSRLPLRDVSTRPVGGRELPRAVVDVGGLPVSLLAAHPLPPVSVLEGVWRDSLADLRREVEAVDGAAVVLGDLNGDRDHAAVRGLLDAGLRDAHDERGRGLARTWPAALPLLQLDHVLVRDGGGVRIAVRSVREVVVPGSDHRGVVADLAVVRGEAG